MDNVIDTKSDLFCKKISFLFINDFNSAFTPVVELEMTGVNFEQNVLKADDVTNQMLKLHQMTSNYFNLELGMGTIHRELSIRYQPEPDSIIENDSSQL